MDHISKLVNPGQQQTESESQMKQSLTDKHIALLWMRLGKIYGHKWESSYGESDDGTWLQGLTGVTPDQVAHGLSIIMEVGEDWPPTLPVFRKMCIGEHEIEKKPNEFGLDYVPQMYREDKPTDAKQLETDRSGHMTASKETVESSLAKLRNKLP